MQKEMNKRGLSDVVTTVLIILFGIVAVAIIGGIVINQARGTGTKIDSSAACQQVSFTPVECKYVADADGCAGVASGDNRRVAIRKGNQDAPSGYTITGINILAQYGDGTSKSVSTSAPATLATNTYTNVNRASCATVNNLGTDLSKVSKVGVAFTMRGPNGNTITCDSDGTLVDCVPGA